MHGQIDEPRTCREQCCGAAGQHVAHEKPAGGAQRVGDLARSRRSAAGEERRQGEQLGGVRRAGRAADGVARLRRDVGEVVGASGCGTRRQVEAEAQFGEQQQLEPRDAGLPVGGRGGERHRVEQPVEGGVHARGGGPLVEDGRDERGQVVDCRRRRTFGRQRGARPGELDRGGRQCARRTRAQAQRDAVAGSEDRPLRARPTARDEGGDEAVVLGQRADDRRVLAVGQDGDDDGGKVHGVEIGRRHARRQPRALAESLVAPYTRPMPHAPFVHLRVQSAYSMLEGAMTPETIAKACRTMAMPAVALADRNNLFGAMEFGEVAAVHGVQPIVGALVAVERPDSRTPAGRMVVDWLVLLVQDATGYDNLVGLVSDAHLAADPADPPHLTLTHMAGRTDGLIALTAGAEGALARLLAEGQDAGPYADALERLFPERLYIEIGRSGDAVEAASEAALLALAEARELPLVATNPARFAEASGHPAHDVLLCIADGAYVDTEERRRSNPEHWLKSAPVMLDRFADLPEATANTLVIAQRCAFAAPVRDPILPSVAGDRDAEAAELATLAAAGLDARLAALGVEGDAAAVYRERLTYEIGVIVAMGFPGYFLIVADFIRWAKGQGIPVGPGRGSGAGSVVAWALTITDLDPLAHGLIFERFLNPERVSMPDFDIDFCETRRGEVIRYVQQRYGRGQVAQIITFGKLKARAVLKDVGRVLQMPYGQVDRIAKLVPNHPVDPWTLARAINGVSELVAERDRDPKVAHLLEIALRLEGLPRHSSTHAAGVVIGDRPLSRLVPMYRDPRSDMPVTQFDMKWVEKAGLVKFDFLGLKTLSVLERAGQLLAAKGVPVDFAALPLDDAATYRLIARGDTVGVFQFESEGMRRALTQVRPDCFADIIALGALYRPGPMENIPSFGKRKNGEEVAVYPHPDVEEVLKETHGIIVYQEQVMQIARTLAGFSLGEADLLRRAMGKKKKDEMERQKAASPPEPRPRASIRAMRRRSSTCSPSSPTTASTRATPRRMRCSATTRHGSRRTTRRSSTPRRWRSTSATPTGWRCSSTTCGGWGSRACRRASTPAGPISPSRARRSASALAALKSVGEKAMAGIVAERDAKGAFASLGDFARRVDPKLLNKRQLEALVGSGAFDGIEPNRGGVYLLAEAMLATAQSAAAAREARRSPCSPPPTSAARRCSCPRPRRGRSPRRWRTRRRRSASISRATRSRPSRSPRRQRRADLCRGGRGRTAGGRRARAGDARRADRGSQVAAAAEARAERPVGQISDADAVRRRRAVRGELLRRGGADRDPGGGGGG